MSKDFPNRSKQHISDDKGIAIFNYIISDYFVSRNIEHNDYGIDCLIDLVETSGDIDNDVLKGKCFCAQLKSSDKRRNSFKIRRETFMYWYKHQLPVFLIHVDWKTQSFKFANIKEQLRENFTILKDKTKEDYKFTLKDSTDLNFNFIKKKETSDLIKRQKHLSQILYAEVFHELMRSFYEERLIRAFSNLNDIFKKWYSVMNRDWFSSIDYPEHDLKLFDDSLVDANANLKVSHFSSIAR